MTRGTEAVCDKPTNDTTARLECRLKAHSAERECLDRAFADIGDGKRRNDAPSAPPPSPTPTRPAASEPPTDQPVTAATQPRDDVATAGTAAAQGWLIGETTSPIDFTPLFVAKLHALAPVAVDAPAILVLRCSGRRTELSVNANGVWRASRTGDVEVTISADKPAALRPRWPLAADGRTASMAEDAAEAVRALHGGRASISVTDGTGRNIRAIFDLAGLDAVRARLDSVCRWPNTPAASKGQ